MGTFKIHEVFVMRGVGTVLMSQITSGTLRPNVALNLGERSANVKIIQKGGKNIDRADEGMIVAIIVTASAENFQKDQIVEFVETGVESSFRT